ncbi:hypothetical protein NBCG_02378 [Nocardioidaceae bacterium Broad-1]|nr:hypothetical protein NBCG_02378 [Nocardioidaceae bacterium Broad-1]
MLRTGCERRRNASGSSCENGAARTRSTSFAAMSSLVGPRRAATRGAAPMRKAAAARIPSAAEAERTQVLAEANAQATRATGLAKADAEAAALAAYRDLPEAVLLGLALKELAANLPQIEHLALTPDLLAPVLAKLGARSTEAA